MPTGVRGAWTESPRPARPWLSGHAASYTADAVPTFEAKNRLSALLAEVVRGAEITITKRGVPVAKLVPAAIGFDRDEARRGAAGLRNASRGTTLGGIKIEDLVNEGRS
jgi:prevent-host-death family protein